MLSFACARGQSARGCRRLGTVGRRVTTTVRMPEELLEEIRQIAREEERPLNTQLLRLIRSGLEQHRAEHRSREQPNRGRSE